MGAPSDKTPWEVRGWDSAKGDKPCPGCGDGKHWWASCPTFPKPNKNLSLTTSAKKTAKAKKAKAASDAESEEASRAIRANVARIGQSEFTPMKDILAGYVDDDSTRSMVARLNLAELPPPTSNETYEWSTRVQTTVRSCPLAACTPSYGTAISVYTLHCTFRITL